MEWLKKLSGKVGSILGDGISWNLAKSMPREAGDPLHEEMEQVRRLLVEFATREKEFPRPWYAHDWEIDFGKLAAAKPILESPPSQQVRYVSALLVWLTLADENMARFRAANNDDPNLKMNPKWANVWGPRSILSAALELLLQTKLPFVEESLGALLWWCLGAETFHGYYVPIGATVRMVENFAKEHELSEPIRDLCRQFLEKLSVYKTDSAHRKYMQRLEAVLGEGPEIPIEPGETWANAAIADLAKVAAGQRAKWAALLLHARDLSGANPSAQWLRRMKELLGAIPSPVFISFVTRWFPLTDKKREVSLISEAQWRARCADAEFLRHELALISQSIERLREVRGVKDKMKAAKDPWAYLHSFFDQANLRNLYGDAAARMVVTTEPPAFDPPEDSLLSETHMDILRGLALACGLIPDIAVARALTVLALGSYRKIPGRGPRATRVGNACIAALGLMNSADALAQLALLKVKVKFGGAQIALEKTLNKLAEKLGMARDDLEEMSVPAYGMTEVGRLVQPIGEFTAELSVIDSHSVELAWKRPDGKPQKALPAAVKQENAEEVKELLAAKKDMEKMLPALSERLDNLYLRRKSWPLELWRERYLDHPLMAVLARRLIWNFTSSGVTTPGLWLKDKMADRSGNELSFDAAATVSLWHPLDQPPDVVLGWRGFLEEWEIVQPFKQAHREVYLLTPAEEQTRVYSNRFAAHLLRQHQFNALCSARSWKNKLRLMVDDTYPPASRLLPQWDLRAEYWIEGAGSEYGTDTLESGAFRYLTTDQVRFYRSEASQVSAHACGGGYDMRAPAEPIPLAEIPPLVFSEIMRDVDLFVGVASVGNDPNWLDTGRTDHQHGYWRQYSWGELGATAQTRKAILERLIPKLKIASQCSFTDRFLLVQGKRHAYKIHLGSGNILISPQDKYLCIVPSPGQVEKDREKLFLPFEGDRTLSVILSKAFLLAADDKIKDETILRQLGA